jgi:hypothetical protein
MKTAKQILSVFRGALKNIACSGLTIMSKNNMCWKRDSYTSDQPITKS